MYFAAPYDVAWLYFAGLSCSSLPLSEVGGVCPPPVWTAMAELAAGLWAGLRDSAAHASGESQDAGRADHANGNNRMLHVPLSFGGSGTQTRKVDTRDYHYYQRLEYWGARKKMQLILPIHNPRGFSSFRKFSG